MPKRTGFSLISVISYSYIIVAAAVCYFSPLLDTAKSLIALPGIILIPYLVGKPILFVARKILSLKETNDFVLDALLAWSAGTIFIVALEAVLYVNYVFSLDYFIIILLSIGLLSIFIKDRASFANIKHKEVAIVAGYGFLFSLFVTLLLNYPLTNDLDIIHHSYFTLNIVTENRPLLFNPSYLPTMDTLFAVPMKLFSIEPDSGALFLLWSSRFILYPIYAVGLFLLVYKFTKNKLMALLAAIIGCSLINPDGSLFPYHTNPKNFINMFFIYGLYGALNLYESGGKRNILPSLIGLGVLLLAIFIPLYMTISDPSGLIGYEIGYILPAMFVVILVLPRVVGSGQRNFFFSMAFILTGLVFMAKLQGLVTGVIILAFLFFIWLLKSIGAKQARILAASLVFITLLVFLLVYFKAVSYPAFPINIVLMRPEAYVPAWFGWDNLLTYLGSTYPFVLLFLLIAGCLPPLILADEENKKFLSIIILASLTMLLYFLPITHSYRFLGNAHPFIILLGVFALFQLLRIRQPSFKEMTAVLSIILLGVFVLSSAFIHDTKVAKDHFLTKDLENFQVFQIGDFLRDNVDREAAIVGCWWYQEVAAHYADLNHVRLWAEGERQDDAIKEIYLSDTTQDAYNKLQDLLQRKENFLVSPDKDGKEIDRFYKAPSELILLYDDTLAGWLGDEGSVSKFFDPRYFETLLITENPNYGGNLYVFRVNSEPLSSVYPNLVMNPSFEQGWESSKSAPLWWEQMWDERWIGHLDNSIKSSGDYSYRMETEVAEDNKWGTLKCEDFKVEAGKTYLVSLKVKTANSIKTYVEIDYYDEGHKVIALIRAHEANQDWKGYSIYVKIPKGVSSIRIILMAGHVADEAKGKASTWFDDIEVIGPVEIADEKS